jgi:Carboxypeptidase regulatory-like domain
MHERLSIFFKTFRSLIGIAALIVVAATLGIAQSTGGVKGKIRNASGEGISGVEVTARRDSVDVRSVRSGRKGDFTLSGLEPGIYSFVFDGPGYNSAIKYNIEIKGNKTVDLGDRLVLVVDKGTLVIVQGSVFFKDGRSVTGAKVSVEKVGPDGTTSEITTVYTNIYGEFVFRQPPGNAKFKMTAKYKDTTASKEIEVDSAAIYRLAISLDTNK